MNNEESCISCHGLGRVCEQQREEDLAAIRQSVAEADAGLGRPFDDVDAEICRRFGWSFDE